MWVCQSGAQSRMAGHLPKRACGVVVRLCRITGAEFSVCLTTLQELAALPVLLRDSTPRPTCSYDTGSIPRPHLHVGVVLRSPSAGSHQVANSQVVNHRLPYGTTQQGLPYTRVGAISGPYSTTALLSAAAARTECIESLRHVYGKHTAHIATQSLPPTWPRVLVALRARGTQGHTRQRMILVLQPRGLSCRTMNTSWCV